mgnify:CR=1 FL=1
MPLYEGRHNAENLIKISDDAKKSITFGTKESLSVLADRIIALKGRKTIALDGWYGVDFNKIVSELSDILTTKGVKAECVSINSVFNFNSYAKCPH